MNGPPTSIIRIVRACPEHRVRIFEREKLWEKGQTGELRLRLFRKKKKTPFVDYAGRLCTYNEEYFLLDDRFPPADARHIVLRAHCFRTDDGSIGGSGKIDPKEMLIGDINYRQLAFEHPRCDLCESGDMIPLEERFYGSSYKPPT